ncbi:MAG: hypothetical protein MUF36_08795 [Bacteroidales bacterium]|jgi:hypothetical protein|nr:hypothetical protein [Bacteroidales bacterium]
MEDQQEFKKIELEEESLKDLDKTRKWSMFLAILGFIGMGLMVIGSLIVVLFLSVFKTESALGVSESLFIIPLIAIAVIYFFPLLYLYRFSKHTGIAVRTLDKIEMHKAFRNLKRYYVFIGILVIVVLAIYVIGIIVAGASLSFLKDLGTGI